MTDPNTKRPPVEEVDPMQEFYDMEYFNDVDAEQYEHDSETN